MASPSVLHQRLRHAGLNDVQVDTVTELLEFSTGQQLWDWTVKGNTIVGHVLSELQITNAQAGVIKDQLEQISQIRFLCRD